MRVGNTLIIVCRPVTRSLNVSKNLSTDHQPQVHRKLLSYITGFRPESRIFAQVSQLFQPEMTTFLELGWVSMGDRTLDPNRCPVHTYPSLNTCPVEHRTLSGFQRRETAESPRAETSPVAAAAGIQPPSDSRTQSELMPRGLLAKSHGQEAQDVLYDVDAPSSLTGQQSLALVREQHNPQTSRPHQQQQSSSQPKRSISSVDDVEDAAILSKKPPPTA